MEYIEGKTVLDLASGEGYGAALMAKKAASVTGIDIDEESIKNAVSRYHLPNLDFIKGSTENIPLPDAAVNVVISFETLEHVNDQAKMMSEIKRVLKPGGLLIISTPDKKNYSDIPGRINPFHTTELTTEEFAGLLNKYFSHHLVLRQQIAFSSVITGQQATGFTTYSGDFDELKTGAVDDHLYNIAFASDRDLPAVKNSLFNGRSVFAAAVTEKENQVINSLTYKAGHILLYPAKLIRRIFKKE
jgi:SAM-dependent methyltransferase